MASHLSKSLKKWLFHIYVNWGVVIGGGRERGQAKPPPTPICPAHGRFFQALLKIKKKKGKTKHFSSLETRQVIWNVFSGIFVCVCVRLHACVCVYENFTLMSINIQTFDLDWHSN